MRRVQIPLDIAIKHNVNKPLNGKDFIDDNMQRQ